jgi:hypothetical protein
MCLKRQNLVQQDTFIKLRGLPFSCKTEDIAEFFQGNFLLSSSAKVVLRKRCGVMVCGRAGTGLVDKTQNVRAQHTRKCLANLQQAAAALLLRAASFGIFREAVIWFPG